MYLLLVLPLFFSCGGETDSSEKSEKLFVSQDDLEVLDGTAICSWDTCFTTILKSTKKPFTGTSYKKFERPIPLTDAIIDSTGKLTAPPSRYSKYWESDYINGKKVKHRCYVDKGKQILSEREYYKNSMPIGISKSWDENGQLRGETTHGTLEEIKSGTYRYDKKSTTYYPNGQIELEIDRVNYIYKKYDENGNLILTPFKDKNGQVYNQ